MWSVIRSRWQLENLNSVQWSYNVWTALSPYNHPSRAARGHPRPLWGYVHRCSEISVLNSVMVEWRGCHSLEASRFR